MKQLLLILLLSSLLSACGGGVDPDPRPKKDTTPPVVTLNGKSSITLLKDSVYNELGATAVDDEDGSVQVSTTGSVNTSVVGTYKITYSASDTTGNKASIKRQVIVKLERDTIPPVITLNGKNNLIIAKGKKYQELGAKAVDNRDGSLDVKITGKVNTAELGSYEIIYSAVDSAGNKASINRRIVIETWFNDLHPYQQSRYANVLKGCVSSTAAFSCTMLKLPLIGQETNNPTEKNILDRVIVSHQWMGDRFKQVLARLPHDMKLLLRSVTAIVIDDDIRPAHYRMGTGAIYLDPAFFWLSNKEKQDISKDKDYRSSYGNDLDFVEWWAYTKNHKYLYTNKANIYNDVERGLEEIVLRLASLLYHELAHASDFAPVQDLGSLDKTDSIYNSLYTHWNNGKGLSWKLKLHSSLTDTTLVSLAKVRFHGKKVTTNEKQMQADYIGALFSGDGAVTHYNYSTIHEDFANLFMASMMKNHFDANIDHAFIKKVTKEKTKCSDFIVGWGTRNRIANPLVINRARFAVENIFPEKNWNSFFQSGIGVEIPKVAGNDWCENLAPPMSNYGLRSKANLPDQEIDPSQFTRSPHESLSR